MLCAVCSALQLPCCDSTPTKQARQLATLPTLAVALQAGVLDPAKVTRSGMTNACSIAGIMLTTQVRSGVDACAACAVATPSRHRSSMHTAKNTCSACIPLVS